MASRNPTPDRRTIDELIQAGEWDLVRDFYENHPESVIGYKDARGATALHAFCRISSTPVSLIQYVVDTWPEALTIQENRFGATPLHLLCWSSQRSRQKVEVLLERMKPSDLMIRNRILGSTPLHSACGNNAELPVIKAIVRKHPPVLLAKTYDQQATAIAALWHSHLQTIPGHMQVAHILKGDTVKSDHFDRFWKKCIFLAMYSFKMSATCPSEIAEKDGFDDEDVEKELYKYVLHGLFDMKAPLNMMKTAVKVNPEWARQADADGNYPLHHVIMRRPFRVKDGELIREVLKAYPQAAAKRNNTGDLPLHIVIRDRMVWEEGLGDIVEANAEALGVPDASTNLYPFLFAASLGGRVAVNTTYQLLLVKPHLVKDAAEIQD